MSFRDFTNGEVFDASILNDFLMRQSIIRVSDEDARNSIPNPNDETLFCFVESTKQFQRYNGTAWVTFSEDTGWATLPKLNGWIDFGSGHASAAYRRTNGIVQVKGMVKSGTTATIGTLPVGFRPAETLIWPILSNNALAQLRISSAGSVFLNPSPAYSNVWVSLDGVEFAAA